MSVDAWTEQRAPHQGDLIQIRDEETGEVDTGHTWEIVGRPELEPAGRSPGSSPWKCWWSVPVRPAGDHEAPRVWFMLAADSFIKVGQE